MAVNGRAEPNAENTVVDLMDALERSVREARVARERQREERTMTTYGAHMNETDTRIELERLVAQGIHDARCGCGQGDAKGVEFYRDHAHLALNALEEAGYVIVGPLRTMTTGEKIEAVGLDHYSHEEGWLVV